MPTGPSTTTNPYLIPLAPNVTLTSIITAGDALPGSTTGVFGGTPDGIGAIDNGDGTVTVIVGHEFNAAEGVGVFRDHGASAGSYIDLLTVDKATLAVTSGDDLIKHVFTYDIATDSFIADPAHVFVRFCSGDLPLASAFYNEATGNGTTDRIFLNGQEDNSSGQAWAHFVTGGEQGNSYELAWMGNAAWENLLANPYSGDATVVIGNQDGGNNHVFIYVGAKQSTGSELEKAGLVGGSLYGIKVDGLVDEADATDLTAGGHFSLVSIANPEKDLISTDTAAENAGATSFLRPEDGAWDPTNHNRYYFVTTNGFNHPSRLWSLDFVDSSHPELGGTITELLDGTEGGHQMFDNLTVDASNGHVILQEDPGNQAYVARGWDYDPSTDILTPIFSFNPAQFDPAGLNFITKDEESSGVVDVTAIFGDEDTHAYLLDAQVHKATGDPKTVEMGQLMLMLIDDPKDLHGGNGKDVLVGGNNNDVIDGGNGKDILTGLNGDDILTGGNANDWFTFDNAGDTGHDTITDMHNGDLVLLTSKLASNHVALAGNTLALFGASTVEIDGVTALDYTGQVAYDGTIYYSYEIA